MVCVCCVTMPQRPQKLLWCLEAVRPVVCDDAESGCVLVLWAAWFWVSM